MDALLKTDGLIPQNGEGGAFGYCILATNTAEGDGSLIVVTTHVRVLECASQHNEKDPIWHNHFVTLKGDAANCAITFQQIRKCSSGKNTKLIHVSNIFTSDDSLTGEEITLEPDNDAQNVVSFKLDPKGYNAGELLAYCVKSIKPIQQSIYERVIPYDRSHFEW